MQFQVDAGDSRPTFFELIAADRLVPSLRAALVYSLGVLAARRPGLTRILDHEAEAFAALMLLVETHNCVEQNKECHEKHEEQLNNERECVRVDQKLDENYHLNAV